MKFFKEIVVYFNAFFVGLLKKIYDKVSAHY